MSPGSGESSTPGTRPTQVLSGSRPKSLAVRPVRSVSSARSSSARPAPAAQVAVNAVMVSGCTPVPIILCGLSSSLDPVLLDVRREIAQGREDPAVVLVVGAQLEAVALGYLQRQFQGVDGIETQPGAEQWRGGIDLFGLDRLQVQRGDDHRGDVALQG